MIPTVDGADEQHPDTTEIKIIKIILKNILKMKLKKMKKIIIYTGLILAIPFLLKAQYTGGIGNGDASAGISNVPLPVQKISSELPTEYGLCQNYPNPFNSVTKIKLQVTSYKFVKLVVYDLLGKEVATLVNEELKAGVYEVRFNAGDLPSGVYFYKLETGNIKETKKMLIQK